MVPIYVINKNTPVMKQSANKWLATSLLASLAALLSTSCTVKNTAAYKDSAHVMEVSISEQKMALYKKGFLFRKYPVSTSKFGEGNERGSYRTPLGKMEVAEKIGEGKPKYAVFKSRKWTGEVIRPNSKGRDPIVTRILWLRGLEDQNKDTYRRCIYIHGTAAERDIGKKASYGCIRMKSRDVLDLYRNVGWGAQVHVVKEKLWINRLKERNASLDAMREADIAYEDRMLPIFRKLDPPSMIPLADFPLPEEEELTVADLLAEDGYDMVYLNLPEDFEIEVD